MHQFYNHQDTIVALSTPNGIGAIAVIRVSGVNTYSFIKQVFKGKLIQPSNESKVY